MKKSTLILTATLLLCLACQKDDLGYNVTHYKTIGEGYIFDMTNNRPLKGATVTVVSCFSGSMFFGKSSSKETFTTDETKSSHYLII
jgi:hypothetical protein